MGLKTEQFEITISHSQIQFIYWNRIEQADVNEENERQQNLFSFTTPLH